jgi:hypothetical protein
MKQIRRISLITAMCFVMSCFMNTPSYAFTDILPTLSPAPTTLSTTSPTPQITPKPTPKPTLKPMPKPVNNESLWYIKKISMKKDHQKLLWDYCEKRKLDYIDMLSLIYTESNFNEKSSSGSCQGYFQIAKSSHKSLSITLKTANRPLDGAININWGTAIYSWIMLDKRVKNLKGTKKRDVALSIFQRGTCGYDKYGINYSFLKIFYKKRSIVSSYYYAKK